MQKSVGTVPVDVDPMDRTAVIRYLAELPELIHAAERDVIRHLDELATTKEALTNAEDGMLLQEPVDGKHPLDGKNETIRQAQLREQTKHHRNAMETVERRLRAARSRLALLENRFSAYRRIAEMLSALEVKMVAASR